MASKLRFCVLSVVLYSLGLLIVSRAESIGANVNQRHRPLSENQQCVHFEHHYCNKFGYNSTIALNPWARELSLEQAKTEFEDFNNLLQNNCSSKLGVFLCFTYFPLCYEKPLGPGQVIVPPCKEICDEVHASGCSAHVIRSIKQWPQHLQCSNFQSKSEAQNGNCAAGGQDDTSEREKETETNTGCEGGS